MNHPQKRLGEGVHEDVQHSGLESDQMAGHDNISNCDCKEDLRRMASSEKMYFHEVDRRSMVISW